MIHPTSGGQNRAGKRGITLASAVPGGRGRVKSTMLQGLLMLPLPNIVTATTHSIHCDRGRAGGDRSQRARAAELANEATGELVAGAAVAAGVSAPLVHRTSGGAVEHDAPVSGTRCAEVRQAVKDITGTLR